MVISLLDFLAEKCGVHYLSDLRTIDKWKPILEEISPSVYPVKEWLEAADYLCDINIKFKTAEEVKSYLLK